MSQFGTCDGGCTEQKLELVPAAYYDDLAALAASARTGMQAFHTIAEELARTQPGAGESEGPYRSMQEAARSSLRQHPEINVEDLEAPELATTWWCAECGGLDAPQPCLGICIWRPLEWVSAAHYQHEWARALTERDAERPFRALLRWVASVTPRAGQWEGGWRTVEARARQTLQAREVGAQPSPTRGDR